MIKTIAEIANDWQETEAQNLRPGSRFQIVGTLEEIFTVVNVYDVLTFGPSELFIEADSQNFNFKDADIVLVVPSHEKTVMIDGAYFYA